MITGVRKDRETLQRGLKVGIDKFLLKPIFLEKLTEAIMTIRNPEYLRRKYQNLLAGCNEVYEKYEKENSKLTKKIRERMEELQKENLENNREKRRLTLTTSPELLKHSEKLEKTEEKIRECNIELDKLSKELKNIIASLADKKGDIKQTQRILGKKLDALRFI